METPDITPSEEPAIDPELAAEIVASYDAMLQSKAWQLLVLPTLESLRAAAVIDALAPGGNSDTHHSGRERFHLVNAISTQLKSRRHNLAIIARGERDEEASAST